MIASSYRFHGHNSLRYVYANGKAVRSPQVTIKWVKNNRRDHSRFSVVVSKKVIKGAIGRNRIRRRLYEYVRLNLPKMNDTYDVVIITTSPELEKMPTKELYELLHQQFSRAHLYKTS